MNQKYFSCSVGQHGKGYDDENLIRCIKNLCFVLHKNNDQKGDIEKIKEGDVLLLKYQNLFIAYGKAIKNLKEEDIEDGWNHQILVDKWIFGRRVDIRGIKENQISGSNFATVKSIGEEFALKKISEIGLLT